MKKFFYNKFMKSMRENGFENRKTIIYGKMFQFCQAH